MELDAELPVYRRRLATSGFCRWLVVIGRTGVAAIDPPDLATGARRGRLLGDLTKQSRDLAPKRGVGFFLSIPVTYLKRGLHTGRHRNKDHRHAN